MTASSFLWLPPPFKGVGKHTTKWAFQKNGLFVCPLCSSPNVHANYNPGEYRMCPACHINYSLNCMARTDDIRVQAAQDPEHTPVPTFEEFKDCFEVHDAFTGFLAPIFDKENDEEWMAFVHRPSDLLLDFLLLAEQRLEVEKSNATETTEEDFKTKEEKRNQQLQIIMAFQDWLVKVIESCNSRIKTLAEEEQCTVYDLYRKINIKALERFPNTKNVSQEAKTALMSPVQKME